MRRFAPARLLYANSVAAMIYIHRTFFAQALLDHPENPLSSPYAPSFLAANRCASVLIKSFLHYFERCPDLIGRFWGIWTHAFSAAVSLVDARSIALLSAPDRSSLARLFSVRLGSAWLQALW